VDYSEPPSAPAAVKREPSGFWPLATVLITLAFFLLFPISFAGMMWPPDPRMERERAVLMAVILAVVAFSFLGCRFSKKRSGRITCLVCTLINMLVSVAPITAYNFENHDFPWVYISCGSAIIVVGAIWAKQYLPLLALGGWVIWTFMPMVQQPANKPPITQRSGDLELTVKAPGSYHLRSLSGKPLVNEIASVGPFLRVKQHLDIGRIPVESWFTTRYGGEDDPYASSWDIAGTVFIPKWASWVNLDVDVTSWPSKPTVELRLPIPAKNSAGHDVFSSNGSYRMSAANIHWAPDGLRFELKSEGQLNPNGGTPPIFIRDDAGHLVDLRSDGGSSGTGGSKQFEILSEIPKGAKAIIFRAYSVDELERATTRFHFDRVAILKTKKS